MACGTVFGVDGGVYGGCNISTVMYYYSGVYTSTEVCWLPNHNLPHLQSCVPQKPCLCFTTSLLNTWHLLLKPGSSADMFLAASSRIMFLRSVITGDGVQVDPTLRCSTMFHKRALLCVFPPKTFAGNLQDVGLLPLGPGGCLVELGAGKGFLGAMIAEAANIPRIVLVDCRVCFKNKVCALMFLCLVQCISFRCSRR